MIEFILIAYTLLLYFTSAQPVVALRMAFITVNTIFIVVNCYALASTYADDSHVSKAMTGVCLSVSVCVCVCVCVIVSVCVPVCPHDKTKTAENAITKVGTG